MRYLLDTCVIFELVARQPDLGVVQWVDSVDEERLFPVYPNRRESRCSKRLRITLDLTGSSF